MKKFIISILQISISFLPIEILAQGKFSIGGVVIPQLTAIKGDVIYNDGINQHMQFDPASTFNIAYGLELNYKLSEHSRLNLGLLRSMQGQDYKTFIPAPKFNIESQADYSTSLEYFKIPVAYEFYINPGKKISFYLSSGFYFAILSEYSITSRQNITGWRGDYINAFDAQERVKNFTYDDQIYGHYEWKTEYTEEPYKQTDLGLLFNAGVEIKLSDRITIPAAINFDFGLTDIKNLNSKEVNDTTNNLNFWEFLSTDNLKEPFSNMTFGFKTGIRIKI